MLVFVKILWGQRNPFEKEGNVSNKNHLPSIDSNLLSSLLFLLSSILRSYSAKALFKKSFIGFISRKVAAIIFR